MATLPPKGARMTQAQFVAHAKQLGDAIKLWQAANEARGLPPSASRVHRVAAKLASRGAAVVPVGLAVDGEVVHGFVLGRSPCRHV